MDKQPDLSSLCQTYRHTLLDDVMPFWMRHGIDANGGINTCIGDDGHVHSRDRWEWSQWRAVWVFSKLYNDMGRHDEWLDVARGIYGFVTATGTVEDDHWPLLLDGDGQIKRGYDSIYVDTFAIYGLTELYRATQDPVVLEHAMKTLGAVRRALAAEAPPPAFPYPIAPGRINHGVSMMCSLVAHELAQVTGDAEVRAFAQTHHRRAMEVFLRPDRECVLEWLDPDGDELPPPEGTAIVPGHAIESMWFQMHVARAADDRATLDRATAMIRRHLELGWDDEYGGLLLAVDADGGETVGWAFADTKLWWPHTEALYATLLAFEHCGEQWCLDWHERVRQYSDEHYPVPVHGEWTQKLDRRGQPITDVVALPVKDPFHLPRALIYCIEVLERLTEQS